MTRSRSLVLMASREMLQLSGRELPDRLELALSSVTCYTRSGAASLTSIRGDVAADGRSTRVQGEVSAVCFFIMLNLFLHGAVPFGYTAPMDDEDAGYSDEEYLRAAREGRQHLHRGKSTVTCFVTCPFVDTCRYTCVRL